MYLLFHCYDEYIVHTLLKGGKIDFWLVLEDFIVHHGGKNMQCECVAETTYSILEREAECGN